MPGTKFDNKKRQTVRNLRIREDTAKVWVKSSVLYILLSAHKFQICYEPTVEFHEGLFSVLHMCKKSWLLTYGMWLLTAAQNLIILV